MDIGAVTLGEGVKEGYDGVYKTSLRYIVLELVGSQVNLVAQGEREKDFEDMKANVPKDQYRYGRVAC